MVLLSQGRFDALRQKRLANHGFPKGIEVEMRLALLDTTSTDDAKLRVFRNLMSRLLEHIHGSTRASKQLTDFKDVQQHEEHPMQTEGRVQQTPIASVEEKRKVDFLQPRQKRVSVSDESEEDVFDDTEEPDPELQARKMPKGERIVKMTRPDVEILESWLASVYPRGPRSTVFSAYNAWGLKCRQSFVQHVGAWHVDCEISRPSQIPQQPFVTSRQKNREKLLHRAIRIIVGGRKNWQNLDKG